MGLLLLSADDLERLLPMGDTVEAMKRAFAARVSQEAVPAPRAVLPSATRGNTTTAAATAARPRMWSSSPLKPRQPRHAHPE